MSSAPPIELRTPRQPLLKRVVSFPVLLGVLLVAPLCLALRDLVVDPDVWWHLRVGQDILATHHWPSADSYSFTAPGAPWIAYEWLGETLLAAVRSAWGFQGLFALEAAVGAAVLVALYVLATLRSRNSKAAFVSCTLLLSLVAFSFTLRPQIFGYFFLVLTLIILELFCQGRTAVLWLLPPLFLVWVNTHGSFVIGLFAFAVFALSGLVEVRREGLESRRWTPGERLRLGGAFLASLAALAITPYGTKLAAYPINMTFSLPVAVAAVGEWRSMPFDLVVGKVFLLLVLGCLLAQIALRFTWRLAEVILFFAGALAALVHARFLLIFVPFCAPLLAVILGRWFSPYQPGKDKHALDVLLMVAVLAVMIRFFPSRKHLERCIAQDWPVEAVRYIEQHHTPGPLYNAYYYGGYLDYALAGRSKVFIDGRADVYERTGVLADYLSIERVAPSALALLRLYNVQSCLLERSEPLATLLAASSEWQPAFADETSALFVRAQSGEPKIEGQKSK